MNLLRIGDVYINTAHIVSIQPDFTKKKTLVEYDVAETCEGDNGNGSIGGLVQAFFDVPFEDVVELLNRRASIMQPKQAGGAT